VYVRHTYKGGIAVDQDIGELIRKARHQEGVSQAVLSGRTGIPPRTLQEYEQGRCRPSAARLMVILQALGQLEKVSA